MTEENTSLTGDSIEDVINFIFPKSLQHPLSVARFILYGTFGPLRDGNLRSGRQGKHVITDWELHTMCLQVEREDLLQIYSHKGHRFETLTKPEQDAVINQADVHLKKAKGQASLPQVSKEDVLRILIDCIQLNGSNILDFHQVQQKVMEFREERIRRYKLVYPNLATNISNVSLTTKKSYTSRLKSHVSSAVATPSMFLKNEGFSDPDLTAETSKLLCGNAFKICNIDDSSDPNIIKNVWLMREVGPRFPDPYEIRKSSKKGLPKRLKERWDDTSNVASTHVGSLVAAPLSTTTYKRKVTLG